MQGQTCLPHPGEPALSPRLAINTNHQVIVFILSGRNNVRRQQPFWAECRPHSCHPPFVLQLSTPTSFTMGGREQRPGVWGPHGSSGREGLSCPPPLPHPSRLPERRYTQPFPDKYVRRAEQGASSWTSAPKTPRSTCANIPVQIHIAHFSLISRYLNISRGSNLAVMRNSAVAPK